MRDLIVLSADLDARLGLQALLARGTNLGFRPIEFDVVKHPNRDNGVLQQAHDFLRSQHRLYAHALAVCDFEGCGRERSHSREEIESLMEQRLSSNGWDGRAAAIVIEPELESWIWGDGSVVAAHLNWPEGEGSLRRWLADRSLIAPNEPKPHRPKESLERVLRQVNRSSSSSLFAEIGGAARVASCVDPAFRKLLRQLQAWFPLGGNVI